MPKVTIYTQAYNPGPYLEQCVESVLGQTYTDFEWILIDNASTDSTPTLIDAYAKKDPRIIPIHMEKNTPIFHIFYRFLREKGTGEYVTYIDSDDWWDTDYLEKLVPFAEENNLDFALTGAQYYFQETSATQIARKLDKPVVLSLEEFVRNFPDVGHFAGAFWASLRPMEKVLAMEGDKKDSEIWNQGMTWRVDTLIMLNYTEQCQRIGINELAPYHYRKYGGSLSRRYRDSYFKSNVYFYQRFEDFFCRHDVLDERMTGNLKERYFLEMTWSLEVLKSTPMSASEKMQVSAQIVTHPLTIRALPYNCQDQTRWRTYVQNIAADALRSGQFTEIGTLQLILRPLAPDCCDVVTTNGLALFARERDLLPLLFQNNRRALTKRFLELIGKEKQPEQFDLGIMLKNALPEYSPLRQVDDVHFFKNYPKLTELILGSGYLPALDQMTALLFEKSPLNSEEALLRLYLTLAALENQIPAFLFGKFRLAKLCQRECRPAECRALLEELDEMGAEFPEMDELKAACDKEERS